MFSDPSLKPQGFSFYYCGLVPPYGKTGYPVTLFPGPSVSHTLTYFTAEFYYVVWRANCEPIS